MKRALTALMSLTALAVLAVTPATAQIEASICDLQLGVILEDEPVIVDSVVVTAVVFNGFWAQELDPNACGFPDRQFSGVWCFRGSSPGVSRGDLVTIEGVYEEYFDETEINLSGGSVTVIGSATVPDPVNVNITDVYGADEWDEVPVAYSGALAENYEGVLVEVTQTNMVSSDTLRTGCFSGSQTRWAVYQTNEPGDSLFVRNSVGSHEIPPPVTTIDFVRGPMSFHRCMRKIVPRDNLDVGFIGPPNLTWARSTTVGGNGSDVTKVVVEFSRAVTEASSEEVTNYFFATGLNILSADRDPSNPALVVLTTDPQVNQLEELSCFNIQSEGGATMPGLQSSQFWTSVTSIFDIQFVDDPGGDDASEFNLQNVTVVGTATSSNINTGTSDFYMADADGAWSGLRIALTGDQVDIGDAVEVSGQITEFFGLTNIAFAGYGTSTNLGEPGTPITPTDLVACDLPYASVAASEQYESCLVSVADAVTDTTDFWENGEWFLVATQPECAGGDSAKTDHITSGMDDIIFDIVPCIGDVFAVTGNVRFSFSEYMVIPRIPSDFVRVQANGNCVVSAGEVTVPYGFGLANYPNPFNPATTIAFTLPEGGSVRLDIFDVTGRAVRTLVRDQVLPAGSNSVRWDGRDDTGSPVASGTYYYRVTMAGTAHTRSMTLLK